MSKIVYATGLTGFIGSHLLEDLFIEYDIVLNFRRENMVEIHFKNGVKDTKKLSQSLLLEFKSNILFHLATNYNPRPKSPQEIFSILEANFYFPLNLITFLDINPEEFTLITTSSYMQLLDKKYQNIYSLSKDMFLNWYQTSYKKIINLSLFDSFGLNDDRNKIVDHFIKKILQEEEIIIPENNIDINLLEVKKITSQIIRGLKLDHGNYVIASDKSITIGSLALLLMDIMKKKTKLKREGYSINYLEHLSISHENLIQSETSNLLDADLKERVAQVIGS